jgi:hypothetical protein
VFFDPDSKLYDKSDAGYAFVITAKARQSSRRNTQARSATGRCRMPHPIYDWFTPDVVKVAEYYEVEERDEKLFILTQALSGGGALLRERDRPARTRRDEARQAGRRDVRTVKRKRVHKYVMSGEEVLADKGIIAGDRIPIAPYYGKRSYVDGTERFEGYVQSKMDVQRLYNMAVSKLAETSAQSPREIPIFAVAADAAASCRPVVEADCRSPRLCAGRAGGRSLERARSRRDPIGKVEAPQIDQATAALVQIARNDLTADQQDGSDQAKANTSEEALAFAATRVDAKSGIFLDNFRQTVQCGGEIYLSMCADIYYEPGARSRR